MSPLSARLRGCCEEDAKTTARMKIVTDENGRKTVIERLVCDRPVFGTGLERARSAQQSAPRLRMDPDAVKEMDGETLQKLGKLEDVLSGWDRALMPASERGQDPENVERAARRARRRVFEYVMAEWEFAFFVTLTVDGAKLDRKDPKTVCKKMCVWCNNGVQRKGLKYIMVPEYHKDGAVHFHGLINAALPLVDSGTVIPPYGGRPIKRATAERKGLNLLTCRTVYNLPGWEYGFSTAIKLEGDRGAVAGYIAKYITKEWEFCAGDRGKIGGRYYYSGGGLREPERVPYEDELETAEGVAFEVGGCCWKLDRTHTELCKTAKVNREAVGPFGRELNERDKGG